MSLFKANPNAKFIVAGDPKQIPPVIEIDEKELENFDFQDENIYKMMNLESFKPEEQKIRPNDTIQNLDTQYRSIPEIGQLFSELSYSGLLKHDREKNGKARKQLPEKFKELISSPVPFVDIPLNQDHSIYKVNKLFYSSYHIYAAIFVSEMIKYFDNVNSDIGWTIGLIAPYRAQAVLLNKLVTSYGISENVKVYADTVHGFQGDECDIVFFICNPNSYEYSNHPKALLSKEYIYNVAISRAKDYLVILHPYTAIQNNNFINKIKLSYQTNFEREEPLNAKDLEKALFNVENYIENNTYISGHDSINVFGLSEMKYFIKVDDNAIDIQLRDLKRPEEINSNNLKHQV
jgi:superfamily I DNA and/or RNA helicase